MPTRLNAFATVALIASALHTTPATAQSNSQVGMRVGYNFRADEPLLSTHLIVPMTSRIFFYPSLDVYAPEEGNRLGFNGDVKITLPSGTNGSYQLYAGAGLGIINRNEDGFSNSDLGANFLMGIESRIGWIHPFAEGKLMIYDRSQFQLLAGVNITLR